MFDKEYIFKGKHANIVTKLTSEIDSETHFKLFERNVDVLIIAPIVGFLYGRKSQKDDTSQITNDNVKKINYQQLANESRILEYNYELIMILEGKKDLDIEKRLDRAFRFSKEMSPDERHKCEEIYEQYILGGIEILDEKLLVNATSIDDYINNIYDFIEEYNNRYNNTISEEEILSLCSN